MSIFSNDFDHEQTDKEMMERAARSLELDNAQVAELAEAQREAEAAEQEYQALDGAAERQRIVERDEAEENRGRPFLSTSEERRYNAARADMTDPVMADLEATKLAEAQAAVERAETQLRYAKRLEASVGYTVADLRNDLRGLDGGMKVDAEGCDCLRNVTGVDSTYADAILLKTS